MERQICSLTSKPWRFSPDPHGDGESLGFHKDDYCAQQWPLVAVPSCFEAGCANLDFYEGICWYRHTFAIPEDWRDGRVVLQFGAVNYRAKVWLNNELLGENRDGFLPFEFELQDTVRWGGDNTLVVSVDNRHHEGDVPGMHVGWRGYGGILREVCLCATNPLYLADVRAIAAPGAEGGDMAFTLRVSNGLPETSAATLEVTVKDAAGQVCAELGAEPITVDAAGVAEATLQGVMAGAEAWSPSSPVRYFAQVRLRRDGETIDEMTVPFGFRRIEAAADGLRLNGEKIYLTGFNRHEDSPRTAMAADHETTRADLEAMKEAGANFLRLCHYPHDAAELDICDELGLLAFAEIPLYFWNDQDEGRRTQTARAETAARQLEGMIARDFNHPSVIFWSVSNETHERTPEVVAANCELIRLARALDPTRLCVHVSNHWHSTPHFEEDDVICVNYYPSLDFQARGHNPGTFNPGQSVSDWRTSLETLHQEFPDRPVLITEFGYSSFAGTHGNSFGEDEHSLVLETEFAALDAPYVCGAAIWCWADHPWPAGRFLGGLSISPFGVVSRDRQKLSPFHTAREMFRAKQAERPAAGPKRSQT